MWLLDDGACHLCRQWPVVTGGGGLGSKGQSKPGNRNVSPDSGSVPGLNPVGYSAGLQHLSSLNPDQLLHSGKAV